MSENEWTDEQARVVGHRWDWAGGRLTPGMMVLDSIDGRTLGYYVGKRGDLIGVLVAE